jgi:hypothetical protein
MTAGSTVTAPEGVRPETGEVVPLPVKFEMGGYLAGLRGKGALSAQQELAAAYDEACRQLIGPNDVQRDGKREFKKKSAWRKLARHFGISVTLVRIEHHVLESNHFLAIVTARAIAPWGQMFEDAGSCGTDEATGRRVITIADAIATASTRASNRAVSNLIAMGEVSAEEIGDRRSLDADAHEDVDQMPEPEPTADTPWPGDGAVQGKCLRDWTDRQLRWLIEPVRRGLHIDIWQQLAQDELKRRVRTSDA